MTNQAEVYLAFHSPNFDPEDFTRLAGVNPTSILRKGVPRPKDSIWKLSSGEITNDVIDIYEMSKTLIVPLLPHSESIIKAKSDLGLEAVLEVVLWITSDEAISTPIIGFDSQVISFIASIGATIDIDTYRNVP